MSRNTYANIQDVYYRLRAASQLLGVVENTLKSYDNIPGITVKRHADLVKGAPQVRMYSPENLFQLAQYRRTKGLLKSPAQGCGPVRIAISVIKGGVGKTTTAVECAIHLQLQGLKVLLIDLDVQANATQMMGYEPDLTLNEAAENGLTEQAIVTDTIASVMAPYLQSRAVGTSGLAAPVGTDVIKKPFGEAGPHLVPSDALIGSMEHALAMSSGKRELHFRSLLDMAEKGQIPGFDLSGYDVILFDCAPSVSFTNTSAIAAADLVIAPVRLDAFSIKGLMRLMQEIETLSEEYGVNPDVTILPTHYAPNLARIARMQLHLNKYKSLLAENSIPFSEKFAASLEAYLPLSLQEPTSAPAKEYQVFARFVLEKVLAKSVEKAKSKSAAGKAVAA